MSTGLSPRRGGHQDGAHGVELPGTICNRPVCGSSVCALSRSIREPEGRRTDETPVV